MPARDGFVERCSGGGACTARGLRAFQPFPDQPGTMKYFQAPPEIFEDPEAMRSWAGGAVAVGRRAAKKKSRR